MRLSVERQIDPRLQAQLASALEWLSDAFVVLDRDLHFAYVNPEAEALIGLDRGGLVGSTPPETLLEAVGPDFADRCQRALRENVPVSFETFIPPAGRWFRVRAYPLPDGLSIMLHDVSEERDAAEERERLHAAERAARAEAEAATARLHAIQHVTDAALSALAVDDLLPELLSRIRATLGADEATVLLLSDDGRSLRVRASIGLEAAVDASVEVPVGEGFSGRVAATRAPLIAEDLVAMSPASPWLREKVRSAVGVPLTVEGRVLGVLHVGTFTPRCFTPADAGLLHLVASRAALALDRVYASEAERRARTDAEESVRLRDYVLGIVSHDLRTPVTAIKGMAQIIERFAGRQGSPEGDLLATQAAAIDANAERMTTMLDDLLDAARLQSGQELELHRSPTDLAALVRAGVEMLRGPALQPQVTLDIRQPELAGMWDGRRLQRVVDNLLSNAHKYSSPAAPITVALDRLPGEGHDWAVLVVRDQGIGIPATELGRIFTPFYRASNAGGRISGTGLGLAGARHIVEQHGGRIDVESIEGEGTTVSVRLPLT